MNSDYITSITEFAPAIAIIVSIALVDLILTILQWVQVIKNFSDLTTGGKVILIITTLEKTLLTVLIVIGCFWFANYIMTTLSPAVANIYSNR